MRVFSFGLLFCLSCSIPAAKRPANLETERFTFSDWEWGSVDFAMERGEARLYYPQTGVSNIGLALGLQTYRFAIELRPQGQQVECRNRVNEVPAVADVLPDATFGCFSLDPKQRLLLAFDGKCSSGILITNGGAYGLERWRHESHGWQEGFLLSDAEGVLRGAISWAFDRRPQNDGVHVDASLPESERDAIALARVALVGMRGGEDLWQMCGDFASAFERL